MEVAGRLSAARDHPQPAQPCTTSPGGSSSGAGAAAAAGFGPLHVGTDAGGSVRIPAAWCGVVGLKPTFGRVPQWPLGAFASVAVAGPMTRTVRDAALMLGAMAQHGLAGPVQPAGYGSRGRGFARDREWGRRAARGSAAQPRASTAPVDKRRGSAQWSTPPGCWPKPVPNWRRWIAGLPDTGHLFATLWSSTALRLHVSPIRRRIGAALLDAALLELADARRTRPGTDA